jgi:hypothetical protein
MQKPCLRSAAKPEHHLGKDLLAKIILALILAAGNTYSQQKAALVYVQRCIVAHLSGACFVKCNAREDLVMQAVCCHKAPSATLQCLTQHGAHKSLCAV